MRFIITTLFLMISFVIYSQVDTSKVESKNIKEENKKLSKCVTLARLGCGIEKSFFSEFGVSRHKYYNNNLWYTSECYYTSLVWVPKFSNNIEGNIYGLKAGYEINVRFIALGVDTKYQSNFKENNLIITPKIGFGGIGILNLFYGYNIIVSGKPFENINNHQFSIVYNFNGKNKITFRLKNASR